MPLVCDWNYVSTIYNALKTVTAILRSCVFLGNIWTFWPRWPGTRIVRRKYAIVVVFTIVLLTCILARESSTVGKTLFVRCILSQTFCVSAVGDLEMIRIAKIHRYWFQSLMLAYNVSRCSRYFSNLQRHVDVDHFWARPEDTWTKNYESTFS